VKIGIYLPPHLCGARIEEAGAWARRAEELGLDTVVMTNQVADPTDALLLATAVVTATSRIGLLGDVTFGPGWTAQAQAEHSAVLDRASGGRFTSAITFPAAAVGGNGLSDVDTSRSVAAMVAEIHRHWRGMGPEFTLPLLIGGPAEQTEPWVAGHADGWLMPAGTPDQLVAGKKLIDEAWTGAGRAGRPTIAVAFHVAFGDDAAQALEALESSTQGSPHARDTIAGSAVDAAEIGRRIAEFSAAGADLVLAVPATSDLTQLDGLAAAALHPVHA
jgi:alkanesulfonate monooxygenase SsuD/methylene tetrahydromethanopterin reductase-like flavin-dependent oxidoreductase (luciferase family)